MLLLEKFSVPPRVLLAPQIVEAFGGKGYFVSEPAHLLPVLREALAQTVRVLN